MGKTAGRGPRAARCRSLRGVRGQNLAAPNQIWSGRINKTCQQNKCFSNWLKFGPLHKKASHPWKKISYEKGHLLAPPKASFFFLFSPRNSPAPLESPLRGIGLSGPLSAPSAVNFIHWKFHPGKSGVCVCAREKRREGKGSDAISSKETVDTGGSVARWCCLIGMIYATL